MKIIQLKTWVLMRSGVLLLLPFCVCPIMPAQNGVSDGAQAVAPCGDIVRRQAGSTVVRQDTVEQGASVEPVVSVAVWNDTSTVVRTVQVERERDSVAQESFSGRKELEKENHPFIALKNNILYDAVLTPNLQMELRLNPHWTMELGAGFNPFPLNDKILPKWRHVLAWAEPKYWFCGAFTRDFVAVNAAYSHFNAAGGKYPVGWLYKDVLDNRFEGDAVMAGLSYGWHFPLSAHFSIELEAGVDAGYAWYDRYECQHCGRKIAEEGRWFAVPKASVSLVVPLDDSKPLFRKRCDCDREEERIVVTVVDTVDVAVVDTVVVTHLDTLVVRPVVRPSVVAVPVEEPVETEDDDELRRLRSGVFRPIEEYVPYTREMVLSSDPNAIYIHFDVGKSDIDMHYMNNRALLDSIVSIMEEYVYDSDLEIKLIQIVGMASFDGREAGNERLAQNRALALRNHIQQNIDLPDSLFIICNGGEGWAEFEWHMERHEFAGKDNVRKLLRTEQDPDKREQMIKRLRNGSVYQFLKKNVLMFQRNSGNIKVFYDTKKKKGKRDQTKQP